MEESKQIEQIVDEVQENLNVVYRYDTTKQEIVGKQKDIEEEKTVINQIVLIGDTHCGSRLGLCSPNKMMLDCGTYIEPSEKQIKMYEKWRFFWDDWIPKRTKGEPFAIGFMGDINDGCPYNSKTGFSNNINDQKHIAEEVLLPELDKASACFFVSGIESHTGKSGEEEENIVEFLGKQTGNIKQSKEGRYAPHEWWVKIGGQDGALIHMMHHIGVTGVSHYQTSAITKEVTELMIAAQKWNEQHPDIVVRGHRHTSCRIGVTSANGGAIGFITPAWQLKTPFAYKTPGGRVMLPEIGGGYAKHGDVVHHYLDSITWGVKRDEPYIITV